MAVAHRILLHGRLSHFSGANAHTPALSCTGACRKRERERERGSEWEEECVCEWERGMNSFQMIQRRTLEIFVYISALTTSTATSLQGQLNRFLRDRRNVFVRGRKQWKRATQLILTPVHKTHIKFGFWIISYLLFCFLNRAGLFKRIRIDLFD